MTKTVFTLSCAAIYAFAAPSWYMNLPTKPYEVIGYAQGNSAELAASGAKEDIASQLKTKVDSAINQTIKIKNGKVGEEKIQKLKITTDALVSGMEKLREEYENGIYYAAYRYDNRPFEAKFADKSTKSVCEGIGSRSIEDTRLYRAIKQELGCRPKIKLTRQNGSYTLSAKNISMSLLENDIERLFFSAQNDKLSITPSKTQLKNGETLSFNVKTGKDGYISLFDVYDDGKVLLVVQNAKIQREKNLKIPEDTDKNLEIAMSDNDGKNSTDMFVAIFSDKSLDLSMFEKMNENLASDRAYKLDELFWVMDKNNFASVVVRTMK
jgi:hypothetical protein